MPHIPFDLTGKVALVTGTSRGLGQYMGRALARAGADLAITSRDADSLAPFQQEIEALGRKAFPVALDVRDYDSIQGRRGGGPRALRPDRHPGEQRGLQRAQARAGHHVGRLEPGTGNQPPRHLFRRPGRGAGQ